MRELSRIERVFIWMVIVGLVGLAVSTLALAVY
jgi:hypothetical protein